MTKPRASIIRSDRRIAARIETLSHLFDVSVATLQRAIDAGQIKASNALGPPLYHVDYVEKLIFGGDTSEDRPAPSPILQPSPMRALALDPSVEAVRAQTTRGRREAAA